MVETHAPSMLLLSHPKNMSSIMSIMYSKVAPLTPAVTLANMDKVKNREGMSMGISI